MKTIRTLVVTLVALIALIGTAAAQDSSGVRKVGMLYHDWKAVCDLTVVQNYAYIADDGSGVKVVDIADPEQPSEVGSCSTPGTALSIAVSNNYLYVADYTEGMRVIDITDPSSPVEVGFCNIPGKTYRVVVSGIYAYVAADQTGLWIIDISDPEAPTTIGVYPKTERFKFGVSGNYLYITDWSSEVKVVDISDPAEPQVVSSWSLDGQPSDLTISGDYAYVVFYVPTQPPKSRLAIFDIKNAAQPTQVISLKKVVQVREMSAVQNLLYLLTDDAELVVIDITNPVDVKNLGAHPLPYAKCFRISGNFIYLACGRHGFKIYDIQTLTESGSIQATNYSPNWELAVEDDYAYIAQDKSGLRVVDVSDLSTPSEVGYCDQIGTTDHVAVSGGYVYVCTDMGGDQGL